MRRHILSAVLMMGGFAEANAIAQSPQPIAVSRSKVPIVLDGHLDDTAWREATPVKLIQQSPHPGEPTPYTTEVRVVLAGDRIYFGVVCRDPDPSKIAVHSLQ